MKQVNREMVVAVIFAACISVFFVCLFPTWCVYYKEYQIIAGPYEQVYIDWEEKYPFDYAEEDSNTDSVLERLRSQYLSSISHLKSSMSSVVTNGTLARYPLSELYCKLQKMIGFKRFESEDGSELLLDNGVLSTQSRTDNSLNNRKFVEQQKEFQLWLDEQGIQYLYVLEPFKTSPVNIDNTYEGYVDYQKFNMNHLAALIEQYDIPLLNLQEEASKTGEVNDLFYKTDHHWKPSTALWAAYQVSEYLNDNNGYQIDVDYYDPRNYMEKDYGYYFLGSQGRKATMGVIKPDNFVLVLPSFNTKLSVSIKSLGIDKIGTFDETLINHNRLIEEKGYPYDYYLGNEYTSYGYGNQPLITVVNYQVTNNIKVLILKDSFANITAPFLSLGIHKVTWIDLRYFTGSIRSYIKEFQPDVVITMINGGSWNLDENYESHTNILDYR